MVLREVRLLPWLLKINEMNLTVKYMSEITDRDCRKCPDTIRWVYLIHNPVSKLTKIGITDNPKKRIDKIRTESGIDVWFLFGLCLQEEYDESPMYVESWLHAHFKNKRRIGEWFELSYRDIIYTTELFMEIEGEDIIDQIDYHKNIYRGKIEA